MVVEHLGCGGVEANDGLGRGERNKNVSTLAGLHPHTSGPGGYNIHYTHDNNNNIINPSTSDADEVTRNANDARSV